MLVQGALQQWLAGVIVVRGVDVEASDATLAVTVSYSLPGSDQLQVQTFQRPAGGGP